MKKNILFFFLLLFVSCIDNSSNDRSNGDISFDTQTSESNYSTGSSMNSGYSDRQPEVQYEKSKTVGQLLVEEGYALQSYSNGNLNKCYNYSIETGEYNSSLHVSVGNGADVVIKLIDYFTNKCIRYVYINAGSRFSINYIPQGNYYLKIAYGKSFYTKKEKGYCIGRFADNAIYERGNDMLDFNVQRTFEGISVPSYNLQLDVISSDVSNSFSSSGISEESFNQ